MAIIYTNRGLGISAIHKSLDKFGDNEEEAQNAEILQDFFQQLKRYVNGETLSEEEMGLFELFVTNLKKVDARINPERLFKTSGWQGGLKFEREVDKIFRTFLLMGGDEQAAKKSYVIGQEQGGTLSELTEEILLEKLTQGGEKGLKKIGGVEKVYSLLKAGSAIRSGKVDVDFSSYQGTATITLTGSNFDKVFNILRQATFSNKNYSSKRYVGIKDGQIMLEDVANKDIHLGSTNLVKAVYGALRFLNFSEDIAISYAIQANENKIEPKSHVFHLKSLYELTGAGIVYKGGKTMASIAKYLIYNDPYGEIWVKSTSSIIRDMLQASDTAGIQVKGNSVVITKDYFKGIKIAK